MAGHSKWANTQHRKNRQDAKRSRLFSRLTREVAVAARLGGPNPADNPRLRQAMVAAVAANLPKANIERAIKRSTKPVDADNFEEVRYEGYAPGGVAVLVDCITDNRNRTSAEVRNAFKHGGGSLGRSGSVAHIFQRRVRLKCPPGAGYEHIFHLAAEAGAEDVIENSDTSVEVLTDAENLARMRQVLVDAGCEPLEAVPCMSPKNEVKLSVDTAPTVLKLLDALDDLEDVQGIHSNAVFPG